jgi:hypothetical protein
MKQERQTHPVSEAVFRQVYDSPASLPGAQRWLTPDQDVRRLEDLLGMPSGTIGAPLLLSGDRKECSGCGHLLSWFDIVTSALEGVHKREMIAQVILGEQKFVNTEAPAAIEGVRCSECQTEITNLRSFKCHNWAYAVGDLAGIIERMEEAG